MATIIEIAKKTGVSIATISRCMNPGTAHLVKAETKQRILSYINKRGYAPNKAAANLKRKKTGIIGLTIPYFPSHLESNDYFSCLIAGVFDFMSESDYDLKPIIVPAGTLNEKQMIMLRSKGIDGLIISGWPTFTQINDILKLKLPVMIINDYQEDIPANFVYADSFQGGYLAGKHLIDLGHIRLGVTTPEPEWFPDMDSRIAGFKKALQEKNLPLPDNYIFPAGVTRESGYQAMLKILKQGEKPQAIFFTNDISAVGALQALNKSRVKCPEDMAIIGFDNIRIGEFLSPTLSTIHQPTHTLGKEAGRLLIEAIEHNRKERIVKKFPTELVIRESTFRKQQ